jgi:uncharacterized caspase-like protein
MLSKLIGKSLPPVIALLICLSLSLQSSISTASNDGPIVWAPDEKAAKGSPLGDLFALVVGVSAYKSDSITPLKLSAKDATDIAEFFKTQAKLFNEVHVKLLIDEKATKAAVEKELYYGLRNAGKDDTIVLFFSGHGAEDPYLPGKFFFLTYDADPENLHATSVKMSGLEFLEALDAKRVVLMADSCHAGGFSGITTKSAAPALKKFLVEFAGSSGKVIITSSRPDQVSLEMPGIGNSVFTHYLLEGLRGASDRDDDGVVTLDEAYQYVYQKTLEQTRGVQHPQFEGSLVGKFPLAISSAEKLDMAELRKSMASVKDSGPQTASLALLTSRPGIIASLDGKKVGQSGNDGLMIIEGLPVERDLDLKLTGDDLEEKSFTVKIPTEYQGRVYKHQGKIYPKPADREDIRGKTLASRINGPGIRTTIKSIRSGLSPENLKNLVRLECLGHMKGPKWLAADPRSGMVKLTARPGGPASGAMWKIHRQGDDVIGLECLRRARNGARWLDGRTRNGEVGLAPHFGGKFTGAMWRVKKISPGVVALHCQGDQPGPKWLDGRTQTADVGLAPSTGGKYTGTRWRIHYTPPPGSFIRALQRRREMLGDQ